MSDPSPVTAALLATRERQIIEIAKLAEVARCEVRAILAGCGADADETMRAHTVLARLEGYLDESLKDIEGSGRGNAAAAPGIESAESVSPRATPTTPAETSALTPEAIEREYIARGHKPLRRLAIVRKPSSAECFAAADALPPDGPEAA